MKVKTGYGMVIVMMLSAVLMSGCSVFERLRPESPEQELALALIGYNFAVHTAADLHDDGVITDDQFLQFNSARIHVDRALTAWRTLLEHGLDPAAAIEAYKQARARLDSIVPELKNIDVPEDTPGG